MATLEIEFHCLCLFVRDEANDVVHVLMPRTHAHHDPHVVMLYHASFPDGRPMHGLELVLAGTGSVDLQSLEPTSDGTIVDLTTVTDRGNGGRKSPPDRVNTKHSKVRTRVTLKSGKVVGRANEAEWLFRGTSVPMAYKVVWEISGVPDTLQWNELKDADPVPFHSLAELPDDGTSGGEKLYKFRLFHTVPELLPPNDEGPGIDPAVARQHFRHLYDVIDHTDPADDELPTIVPRLLGKFNCGAAQVELA
ncbi:MAG TPA: hypothetical protein VEY93_00640 [Longimicrobium sp.]|nr:hypothetical protein [Longimicrobium sp.]